MSTPTYYSTSIHTKGLSCTIWPQYTPWPTDRQTEAKQNTGPTEVRNIPTTNVDGMDPKEMVECLPVDEGTVSWINSVVAVERFDFLSFLVVFGLNNPFWSSETITCNNNNWMGQAKRRTTEIPSKAVGGGIFRCFFSKFDKCRPEVVDEFISSVAVD